MKRLNNFHAFTLPYFIALILMLSTYSYKLGSVVTPINSDTSNSVKNEIQPSAVLGDQDVSVPEPLLVFEDDNVNEIPSEVIETTTSIINADGTRTETYRRQEGAITRVRVLKKDIFGVQISEYEYEGNGKQKIGYVAEEKSPTLKRTRLSASDLSEKVRKMGYTYINSELISDPNGSDAMYRVKAHTRQRFLGLFSVNIPTEIVFQGVTGTEVSKSQSLPNRVLDFLSI